MLTRSDLADILRAEAEEYESAARSRDEALIHVSTDSKIDHGIAEALNRIAKALDGAEVIK